MMGIHDLEQFKKGTRDGFIGTYTRAICIKRGVDIFIRVESSFVLLPLEKARIDFLFDRMNVISKGTIVIGKRALVVSQLTHLNERIEFVKRITVHAILIRYFSLFDSPYRYYVYWVR
jgi:hypothetical protein